MERATMLTLKMTTAVYTKRGDYFDTRLCGTPAAKIALVGLLT